MTPLRRQSGNNSSLFSSFVTAQLFLDKTLMMKSTAILLVLCFSGFSSISQSQPFHELAKEFNPASKPFYFGVASGDPHPDGVVIWTKLVPESHAPQQVNWEIALDTAMTQIVQSGLLMTDESSAYTVKIELKGLKPGTTYFYRFNHEGHWSAIGRTKTAPQGDVGQVTFAVASCSDYTMGYFNAYGHIAARTDLDAIIHLGDYIYEYGNYKSIRNRLIRAKIRKHIPDHELQSMTDYRTRYGQYRLDPQLMEAHRLHPFIVVWDDHEFANDSYTGGAQNHQDSEGDWQDRAQIARQVYFEWLPVRENPTRSIVRSFSFGNLADLWMLDSRQEDRTRQAKGKQDPSWQSEDRHIIGREQADWLLDGIASSKAQWKVIGNQVIFTPLNDSKVFDRTPERAMDRWDGYPAERKRLFDFFYQNEIDNIIVVTGDVHTAWAFELTEHPEDRSFYDPGTGAGVIGAEFVTPSISALNFDEVIPRFLAWEAKRRFRKKSNNPHLRFLNLIHHGYLSVTFTEEKAMADWFFVRNLKEENPDLKHKTTRYILNHGGNVLKK